MTHDERTIVRHASEMQDRCALTLRPPLFDDSGSSRDGCHPLAPDDDEERNARVPLLGKEALVAHRLARRPAAESDEGEQPDAARSPRM